MREYFDEILQDLYDDYPGLVNLYQIYNNRWEVSISFRKEVEYSIIRPYLDQVIGRSEFFKIYLHGMTIWAEIPGTGIEENDYKTRFYETLPNEDELGGVIRLSLYVDTDPPKKSVVKKFLNFISPNKTPFEQGSFSDDY